MTGKQLKNAILQLAIQGKLVPQDANDEPASVLLAKIRKEKEQLVKAGKLKKKELETTPITDEEKPFEIPKSWEWCRLGEIFIHASGKQQSSNNKSAGTPQKFITTSNLYWNKFELDNVKVMNFTEEEMQTCSATKGDLLVCEGGAGYGRSAIWPYDYDICLQNHIHRLRPIVSGICDYIYYIIYLLKESNRLASVGTAMPGLSANRLKGLIIPLPPLSEQKRIVAKIEELMPLVEEYGVAQEKLNRLNAALPEALKKSILQQAIQGKLVPQDANDEPASVLLTKIRKEKEQLVKAGKLKKKELETTPITDEEKPFEIPKSWEWVRLIEICSFLSRGKSPSYADAPTDYPVFAQKCNLKDGGISLEQARFLKPETISKWQEVYHLKTDDVLVNSTGTGTVCRTRIFNESCLGKYPFAIPDSHVSVVRTVDDICSPFIYYLFNSKFYQDYWEDRLAGSTNQKELYIGVLQNTIIPLPPLSEQRRIVARVEELLSMVEGMK